MHCDRGCANAYRTRPGGSVPTNIEKAGVVGASPPTSRSHAQHHEDALQQVLRRGALRMVTGAKGVGRRAPRTRLAVNMPTEAKGVPSMMARRTAGRSTSLRALSLT